MSEQEDVGIESEGEGEMDIRNIDEQLDQLIPPQLTANQKIDRIDELLSLKAASKKIQKGAKKSIFLSKAVRRRLQNRRSALKSRLRKNKLIDDLNHNENGLKIEVEQMKSKITELESQLRMALDRNSQLERQLLDMKAHAAPSQHLKKNHLDDAEKRPAVHEADSCGTPEAEKDPKKMRIDKCPIFHNFHKPAGRQSLDQTPPMKLTNRRPSHGQLSSSNSGNPDIDGMGVLTKGGLIEPGQSQPPDTLSLDDAAHHPKDDSKIQRVNRQKLNLQGPIHDSSSEGGEHHDQHEHLATASDNSEVKAMNELLQKCPMSKQLGFNNSNNSPQQIFNQLLKTTSGSNPSKCPILNGQKQGAYTPSPKILDYIKTLFGDKPASIQPSPSPSDPIPPQPPHQQNSAKSMQRSIPKFSFDSTLRSFNQQQNSPHFKVLPDKTIHFRNFNYQIPNQPSIKQPRSSFNVSEIHDLHNTKAQKPPSQLGDIADMILGKHSTGNQFSANAQNVHQNLNSQQTSHPQAPQPQQPQQSQPILTPSAPYLKQKKSSFDMVQMMGQYQNLGPFSNQPFKQSNVPTPENKQLSPWKKLVDSSSAVGSDINIHNFLNTSSQNRPKVQPPMNRHQRYRDQVQSSEFEFARQPQKPPMTLAQANNLFKKFTY